MAAEDSLLILPPHATVSVGSGYPSLAVIDGASTPAEKILVTAFDDTLDEVTDYYCCMPAHYSGTTGVTITIVWSAVDVSTDVVEWQVAFRRVEDDTDDLTASHTYVFNLVVATAPTVSGEVAYDEITFTDGADMDSVAAGDYFLMRVRRETTPSSGTNATGDAYLHMIHMTET